MDRQFFQDKIAEYENKKAEFIAEMDKLQSRINDVAMTINRLDGAIASQNEILQQIEKEGEAE